MIIAGTTIGAGMLAIPIVTAGIWFYTALAVMIFSALVLMSTGLYLLEVGVQRPLGDNYHTLVREILGKKWSYFSSLCVVAAMYSAMYAYISTGTFTITDYISIPGTSAFFIRVLVSSIFTLWVAGFVGSSVRWVAHTTSILVGLMIITFLMMTVIALPQVSLSTLNRSQPTDLTHWEYWKYLPYALPVCLASFGFHVNVPSLVKHFRGDITKVKYSVCLGVIIALVIYVIWLFIVYANIPRASFHSVQGTEDEVVRMMHLLAGNLPSKSSRVLLLESVRWFGLLALVTSFFGIGLALFDYFLDFFRLEENAKGRCWAGLLTFLPPYMASLIAPRGFVAAISFVGLTAAFWTVIIPVLLAYKLRPNLKIGAYRVLGGTAWMGISIISAVITILAALAMAFNLTPKY